MNWIHAREIREIQKPDGKAKICILARHDGLYEYRGFAEFNEDGEVYWGPAEHSGLFATADEAERNAFDEVPWLRRLANNPD